MMQSLIDSLQSHQAQYPVEAAGSSKPVKPKLPST
jgi:hypothetical protein